MPDATKVHDLIAARYPRSMDAWRERLDAGLDHNTTMVPIVVRIERGDDHGRYANLDERDDLTERVLQVRILRHLGDSTYIVYLLDHADQNQLALEGHLAVTRGGHRITAV